MRGGRVFRAAAVAATAIGLGLVLWLERAGLENFPWRVSWPLFLGAVLALSVGPLAGACVFWLIVRDLAGSELQPTARLWMRAFLARYVPLGALTIAVRIRGRQALGSTRTQILSATFYEQIVAVAAGSTVATVGLALSGRGIAAFPAIALAGAIVVATTGSVARRLRVQAPSSAALVCALGVSCCGWIVSGVAAWTLLIALAPDAPSLAFATGVCALAWVVGFVVPFAPSGIGAREAALVGLLAGHYGVGPAAAIAVVLRVANVLGDLLAAGLVETATTVVERRTVSEVIAVRPLVRPHP